VSRRLPWPGPIAVESKYKRRAAAGRRGASHKSARLINTARRDGASCASSRVTDAAASQHSLTLLFNATPKSPWPCAGPTMYPPSAVFCTDARESGPSVAFNEVALNSIFFLVFYTHHCKQNLLSINRRLL